MASDGGIARIRGHDELRRRLVERQQREDAVAFRTEHDRHPARAHEPSRVAHGVDRAVPVIERDEFENDTFPGHDDSAARIDLGNRERNAAAGVVPVRRGGAAERARESDANDNRRLLRVRRIDGRERHERAERDERRAANQTLAAWLARRRYQRTINA